MNVAIEWQSRPLASLYPIVYFDAIHYKIKDSGKVLSKAAYTALGIDVYGKKDILGIWIGESVGAHFWLSVVNELKNRGVDDIFRFLQAAADVPPVPAGMRTDQIGAF